MQRNCILWEKSLASSYNIMGFPIGDLLSIISFLLASAHACQLFKNDLMATCKRSKKTKLIFIAWISSAEHFNFKRYLIESEVI